MHVNEGKNMTEQSCLPSQCGMNLKRKGCSALCGDYSDVYMVLYSLYSSIPRNYCTLPTAIRRLQLKSVIIPPQHRNRRCYWSCRSSHSSRTRVRFDNPTTYGQHQSNNRLSPTSLHQGAQLSHTTNVYSLKKKPFLSPCCVSRP